MIRIRLHGIPILFLAGLLACSWGMAEEELKSSNPVEVVIEGKQYKSIRAYKQEQIKKTLKRSLSSFDLTEFTEDELYEIMRSVRSQQQGKPFSKKRPLAWSGPSGKVVREEQVKIKEEDRGLGTHQMQEMLDDYRREHDGAVRVTIDPTKVKSIIITPEK